MGRRTSRILDLIEASINKIMPGLPSEERKSLKDLIIKLVLMTSSPEISLEEVENTVLEFVKSSGREYRRYIR
jgi:hypothetical protein